MSKPYIDFGFIPDFSVAPQRGLIDEKIAPQLGSAAVFIEWPWDTPQRIQTFQYVLDGPTELRAFKLGLDVAAGRHAALYVPTWERDIPVAESIVSGSNEVEIFATTGGYAADFLTDDREDTPGRVLYFWTAGQTVAHITRVVRVKASTSDPGVQEVLELEDPLPYGVDVTKGFYGWAIVSRLASDEVEWNYLTESNASTSLEFRQLRTYVEIEGSLTLDEVAAPTATSEAFTTVVITNADANGDYDATHTKAAYCEGPATRTTVAHPYRTAWAAWLGTGGIRFEQTASTRWPPSDSDGTLSTLENSGAVDTDHMSFCFDGAAVEVFAYETTRQGEGEQFQLRHFDSGAQTRGPFTGYSPSLVFNGIVMVPPTSHAADSDVVCVYLKTNQSSLFARIDRDDFATEVELCQLPFTLIRIISVARDSSDNSLKIVAIDSGLRRVEINSAVYS